MVVEYDLTEPEPEPEPEPKPELEPKLEPIPEPEPEPKSEPVKETVSLCVDIPIGVNDQLKALAQAHGLTRKQIATKFIIGSTQTHYRTLR